MTRRISQLAKVLLMLPRGWARSVECEPTLTAATCCSEQTQGRLNRGDDFFGIGVAAVPDFRSYRIRLNI
jgi:hypothetical protein